MCFFPFIQLLWGHIWRSMAGLGLPSARKVLAQWSKSSRGLQDGQRLEHMKLEQVGLFTLKKRRLRQRPLHCLPLSDQKTKPEFTFVVHSNRIRGKGLKLEHEELRLDTKLKIFNLEGGQILGKGPRNFVEPAPSVQVLKDLTVCGPQQLDLTCLLWAWG